MHDIIVGVFEHLELTSIMDEDKGIKCSEIILRLSGENKYIQIISECKEFVKGLYGYQWTLGFAKGVSIE